MIKIAHNETYALPLPEGHRFPMLKYELIPAQLLHEGSIDSSNIFSPAPCLEATILRTHDRTYYDKLLHQTLSAGEQRRIGFPQSQELTIREHVILQGTIDCCLYAKQYGVALNVAGGTHHAFADRGEGFCLLNDMAVAANYLLDEKLAEKILIIDLDVHQGNGTDDETYLSVLSNTLPELIKTVNPDFAFFLSGVDILETDKFGKFKVTTEGCKQRDKIVFSLLKKHHIPVTVAMGGGYSPDIRDIVDAHCNTFRTALDIWG